MYDPQGFGDLQDDTLFGDPNSWLAGEDSHRRDQSSFTYSNAANNSSASGNLDRRLFNDLVEMVPLIEHLIGQKERRLYTRRGSMIYTKTPSRESRKASDPKGRISSQSLPPGKKRDQMKNASADLDCENSTYSLRTTDAEKEELIALREQVKDLYEKLAEKDELLKSAEMSKTQEVTNLHAKLDELKHSTVEKDSLIKSMQLQLSDLKIKLADKQAILEKIQWEAKTSSTKAEKIQEQLDAARGEISFFMHLFEGLIQDDPQTCDGDYDATLYEFEPIPYLDETDETDLQKMEEAREAYIAAVTLAKERQDEESLAVAARARTHLQSFVFPSQNIQGIRGFASIEI